MCEVEGEKLGGSERSRGVGVGKYWTTANMSVGGEETGIIGALVFIVDVQRLYIPTHFVRTRFAIDTFKKVV